MESALELPSTLPHQAGGRQGKEQGKQATQVRGSWSSNWNIGTSQGALRQTRYPSREGKEATARAHGLAPMGALLSACGDKRQSTKRGCDGSPALRMSLGLWALPLQWSMLPSKHPLLQSSSVLSPHAVFSLPLSVCFLGWLSKLQIPAPRPCVHPQTPISGWGALGGSTNRLCRPHSVSPRPGALLFSKPLKHPFCLS